MGESLGSRLIISITMIFLMPAKQRMVNASLFLPFPELIWLSLTGNQLLGCTENQVDVGFEKLSALTNLEVLDISENGFANNVTSSLAHLCLR
ncbi:unnamed protein product [Linum tenue]|uniref:Uncharacterized protein n=1 Tax=Linum tenue TaxID=586396 RepID=A0AAV0HUV7_9ROSI|nr:unnamed protein product [Linum tenue]